MAAGWAPARISFRKLLSLLIVFSTLLFLVFPTLLGIFSRWLKFDESYSHGFLLLAVSAFLVVRAVRFTKPVPGFYPLWLVPFALALLAFGLGGLLRVEALQHLMVVPLLLGALAVLLGWRQVRFFILPVGLLFFAMPMWDFLSWTLQVITVEINRLLLSLFDIEFRVEGVFVYLIGVGAFEVANGCSGLRYLLVGQSLSVIYGELNLRSVRARVILFFAGVALALFANWVRVFVIIYMGYETNMQTSLIEDHDGFGWWVFAATLVPLFFIARRLEGIGAEKVPARPAESDGQGTPAPFSPAVRTAGILVTAALPLLVWAALPGSSKSIKTEPQPLAIHLVGEQYGPLFANNLEGWKPEIKNADGTYARTFFDRDLAAEESALSLALFAGVYSYDYQRESAEVIQYANRVYDRELWHTEAFFRVTGPDGEPFKGVTLRHRHNGQIIHIAYSYFVEGYWETDELRAKLAQVWGFSNSRTDASLVAFGVSCEGCEPEVALGKLVASSLDDIMAGLDGGESGRE